MPFTTFAKTCKPITFAAILAAALITAPVFAHGNGGGNAGGNGGGSSHGNTSSHANKASASTASTSSADSADSQHQSKVGSTGLPASSLGALNGFLHASPSALAHASPKSRVGKIATVYNKELQAYLANPTTTNTTTLSQLRSTLASAANKPLSPSIIQAVDAKLAATNTTLANEISSYQGGASGLASAINNAH